MPRRCKVFGRIWPEADVHPGHASWGFRTMTDNDTFDTELSPAEREQVARLPESDLALIDAALLSQVTGQWRKVARVVGMAMLSMPDHTENVPDAFFARRVALLVESGRLESQGDLRRMRFSEVRWRSA
ncbi:hypothetical protein D3C85_1006580 [compost metagenome]